MPQFIGVSSLACNSRNFPCYTESCARTLQLVKDEPQKHTQAVGGDRVSRPTWDGVKVDGPWAPSRVYLQEQNCGPVPAGMLQFATESAYHAYINIVHTSGGRCKLLA